jgi:hypothetical protein
VLKELRRVNRAAGLRACGSVFPAHRVAAEDLSVLVRRRGRIRIVRTQRALLH